MRMALVLLATFLAAQLAAAQTWNEDGDAPPLLPGQTTNGSGTLTTISGTLINGSDVDVYAIYIEDEAAFSASTVGGTSIDSALYLFDAAGLGVCFSEDSIGAQSTLTSTFVTANGLYYLAMSGWDYDPLNAGGLEIWNDTPWNIERAPDGPGAPGPLASWGGSSGASGAYSIFLTGVRYADEGPPPPTGACCFISGACQVRTAGSCAGFGGTYQGDNSVCDPNPCPQPTSGACCFQNGVCVQRLALDCLTIGGLYQGNDTTCLSHPCPQPVTGACCFFTNGCLKLTQSDCAANGGTYEGSGTYCWPNPCGADPNQPSGLQWQDNFDSYDNGTVLYNVGGWTGWDNNPAAAGIVTNVQARSAPHSIEVRDTSDAIHPFTGFEGGRWTLTAWQYIPSNLSGTTYFVVNSWYQHFGPYYWTVELHFDPATDLVNDAIRDPGGASSLPIVYDQWVEIRCEIDLTAGLGSISEYYNNQLLFTGNWIAGSIGQLNIGNVDLYAPHATPVYYDDLSLLPNNDPPPGPTGVRRPLFAGLAYGDVPTRTTDLAGFPNVTWYNGFDQRVDSAAARPDGALYLGDADFTTHVYIAPMEGPAIPLFNLPYPKTTSGLAYGRNRLFGFMNYATPMGIYELNPVTGQALLIVDTSAQGYRYFALDYNATDGKLYGYTEYGSPTGLHAIDIDTGQITPVAASVPAGNSAARGLACGYNKVYALTVYGEYPMFMYDLAQGAGGTWTPMTHPYPSNSSGGGAAFAPGQKLGDVNCDGVVDFYDIDPFVAALAGEWAFAQSNPDCLWLNADCDQNGTVDFFDIDPLVALLGD